MKAPVASTSSLYAQSDTLCRAASTLISVAAGTRAAAAPRARDPGSQSPTGPLRRKLRTMKAPVAPNEYFKRNQTHCAAPQAPCSSSPLAPGPAPRSESEIPAASLTIDPLRHELRPLQAPIAPNSLSSDQSDTLCRAASTLITVAAGTRAGAAPTARDPGSQPRHRPAAA
jgi:hypothetical protein